MIGDGDAFFIIALFYSIGPVGVIGFPLVTILATIVFIFLFREPKKKPGTKMIDQSNRTL